MILFKVDDGGFLLRLKPEIPWHFAIVSVGFARPLLPIIEFGRWQPENPQ